MLTKMPVQRVDNAEDLAALLRFLEQATRYPYPTSIGRLSSFAHSFMEAS